MDWLVVSLCIVLGIVLIVVEVIFIPGTTVVGIVGFILLALGVYLGYDRFGNTLGTLILVATVLLGGTVTVLSFRTGAWNKFSLKDSNQSKIAQNKIEELQVGEQGKTVSALRPSGKGVFKHKTFEVTTNGAYIDAGKSIQILKISQNKVFVEEI